MASGRDLKAKIKSITNTKKITRTMELVATSKAQRAQKRVNATTPYSEKLRELLVNLTGTGSVDHPLVATREAVKRTAALVITGQRGLCGGYNTNVMSLFEKFLAAEGAAGREVDIHMVGRKGLGRLKFLKLAPVTSYTNFDDRPSFPEAAEIAEELMEKFTSEAVDRVAVFSTRYISAGTQRAEETQLLPIQPPEDGGGDESTGGEVDFIFEPSPEVMLRSILPLSVKNVVYRLLVEAIVSEQLARRMAMKRATDNAEEMLGNYRRLYNRSRQAGITQQITEIVGGASALE